MPPTSQPALSSDELSTLSDWLREEAPSADTECEGVVSGCEGPECLPCEVTHRFVAHAESSDAPYPVPERGNPYRCFAFPSPFEPGDQATAWAPIIDDERVLHHWILYRTPTRPDIDPLNCQMPVDSVGLMGWAPGGGHIVLPDEVGLGLSENEGEWLILQMHYWNAAGYTGVTDASGVGICAITSPRPHEAGVLTVGSTAIGIPPRAPDHTVTGLCPATSTLLMREPLTVLSATPHMHRLGSSIRTTIQRRGIPSMSETLIGVEEWSFDDQQAHWFEEPPIISPGDAVQTRCTYNNPASEWAYFGERSEDEMCFNFLLVYPIDSIPESFAPTCVTALGL